MIAPINDVVQLALNIFKTEPFNYLIGAMLVTIAALIINKIVKG